MKYEIWIDGEQDDVDVGFMYPLKDAQEIVSQVANSLYRCERGFSMIWVGTRGLHIVVRTPDGTHVVEARRVKH